MAEQRFSISESCALLDIDRVTLMRWMALEGIVAASDPRDKRYKYLSREQVLHLAHEHGRTIRDETSIGPRLSGVQRDMLARIQQLEEQIATLQHQQRSASIVSPYQTRAGPRQTAYTPPQEREATSAAEPSESPSEAFQAPRVHVPVHRAGALQPGEWHTLPPIPPGWVTPSAMARELGVPLRTFTHALRPRGPDDRERHGHLDYHEGRWQHPHPGNYAAELLDADQQEAARQWFRR